MSQRLPVIHDHDGHIDDLISLAMLATAPEIKLHATTLTPADCYLEPSTEAVEKFLMLFGSEAEFARGTNEGINPFPDKYRKDSHHLPNLPVFNSIKHSHRRLKVEKSAPEYLAGLLSGDQKYNVIETGPLTNIADALMLNPKIAKNINHIWAMGGAIHVNGNVENEAGHDGTAEWNFYNHPKAAQKVLSSDIPMTLISLDSTHILPLTKEFVRRVEESKEFLLSRFAFEAWQIVMNNNLNEYYLWDVLTVAAFMQPDLFEFKAERISVVIEGPSQGRTIPDKHGVEVIVPIAKKREAVEEFFIHYFRR